MDSAWENPYLPVVDFDPDSDWSLDAFVSGEITLKDIIRTVRALHTVPSGYLSSARESSSAWTERERERDTSWRDNYHDSGTEKISNVDLVRSMAPTTQSGFTDSFDILRRRAESTLRCSVSGVCGVKGLGRLLSFSNRIESCRMSK